jgi:CRISPR system Cascade subunit CasE
MTFLSRLILDPLNTGVRLDLANCQELHITILKSFPQRKASTTGARQDFGVLFRVDPDGSNGVMLIVQSAVEPDWSELPTGYLAADTARRQNPAWKRIDTELSAIGRDQVLSFRLRANPTKRIHELDERQKPEFRGKRVELVRESDRTAWLTRKAGQSGFEVLAMEQSQGLLDARATQDTKSRGWRRSARHDSARPRDRLTLASVTFEGRLRVLDPDRVRGAIASGIGPGKAYGFGLLSIGPPRR